MIVARIAIFATIALKISRLDSIEEKLSYLSLLVNLYSVDCKTCTYGSRIMINKYTISLAINKFIIEILGMLISIHAIHKKSDKDEIIQSETTTLFTSSKDIRIKFQ